MSTNMEEPLVLAFNELKINSGYFEKWLSNAKTLEEAAVPSIIGLLQLQAYIATLLSLHVASSDLAPTEIQQEQQLFQLAQEIAVLDQNSESMKIEIKLKEALDLSKNLLKTSQETAKFSRKDNYISAGIAIGATAIGCGIAYFANIRAPGAVGTVEATGLAEPMGNVDNGRLIMTAGAVGGGLIGAVFAGARHFRHTNRIDFEAKMRYMELKLELIRIKSLAEQIRLYYNEQEVISQFIEELEKIDTMVQANVT